MKLQHQQSPEVIHIGVRRAADHQIAQSFKQTVAVIAVSKCGGFQAKLFTALQTVRRHLSAGIVLNPVYAVGVCGQRPHSGLTLQSHNQA